MKKLIILSLALVLLIAGPVAAAEKPIKGGTVKVCVPDEPPGLDPTAHTAAAVDRVVYSNVFEGLLKVNAAGQLVPGLAEKIEASPDGLVYTFRLRKGVKFHNGEPFNAAVAKWNLERGQAENTINPHPEYFRVITKIETPDEYTLIVTLKEPNALFLPYMAEGDAVMLPMKGYEEAKSNPIGTGPFKFVKWNRGDSVEIARFEGYWNPELPYLDKLTFRFIPDPSAQVAALKAGDVDVIVIGAAPEPAKELAKDARFKVLAGTTTNEVILSTNNKVKPFDNQMVRQAMAMAIDRKMVVDLAMSGYGTPIGSHWSPGTMYYADMTKKFPYNPQKAKELLAKAGYPNGFEAVIKVPTNYAYAKRSAEVVTDLLGQVGIKLTIEPIEWGQWVDRVFKKKEFQLTIIGHAEAWDIGIYAKPGYYFQYESDEFKNAYSQTLKALNEEERGRGFIRCQEIIAEEAVNGFLFSLPSITVLKTAVMGWWENYPTIALDATQVWIKK